jgi:hypothetical protein
VLHLLELLLLLQVCDFGLSRVKQSTFLTSKSHGGTPEWMAPGEGVRMWGGGLRSADPPPPRPMLIQQVSY